MNIISSQSSGHTFAVETIVDATALCSTCRTGYRCSTIDAAPTHAPGFCVYQFNHILLNGESRILGGLLTTPKILRVF